MKVPKIELSQNLAMSKIVQGFWRLMEWEMSDQQLENFINQLLDLGVSTFDHADIYGDYQCEARFGQIIKNRPLLRDQMTLVSKCGIKLKSQKYPNLKLNYYDHSYNHIVNSVEQSLKNLNTDRLDLLLIHRPSPLSNPEEIARAFSDLHQSGKVLNFGVSNYITEQWRLLKKVVDVPLVTNQLEVSPFNLEHFDNDLINVLMQDNIKPMAWSPMAGGKLLKPTSEKSIRIYQELEQIASELDVNELATIIYAWLLKHPSGLMPIVGSGKIERVKHAVDALNITLSTEQWFRIWVASKGEPVP